jgi:hypothetical protein
MEVMAVTVDMGMGMGMGMVLVIINSVDMVTMVITKLCPCCRVIL